MPIYHTEGMSFPTRASCLPSHKLFVHTRYEFPHVAWASDPVRSQSLMPVTDLPQFLRWAHLACPVSAVTQNPQPSKTLDDNFPIVTSSSESMRAAGRKLPAPFQPDFSVRCDQGIWSSNWILLTSSERPVTAVEIVFIVWGLWRNSMPTVHRKRARPCHKNCC